MTDLSAAYDVVARLRATATEVTGANIAHRSPDGRGWCDADLTGDALAELLELAATTIDALALEVEPAISLAGPELALHPEDGRA